MFNPTMYKISYNLLFTAVLFFNCDTFYDGGYQNVFIYNIFNYEDSFVKLLVPIKY